MDETTKRLERRHAELSRIKEAKARWWRKLMRAANAIEKLNAEERRLLKPRRLEAHEALKIDGRQWHAIRERDLSDDLASI